MAPAVAMRQPTQHCQAAKFDTKYLTNPSILRRRLSLEGEKL
jgi:hypothetical protein